MAGGTLGEFRYERVRTGMRATPIVAQLISEGFEMNVLRRILGAVAVLALLSPAVFAGRMVLNFGDMRSRNMSIVLATIENVQQVSRPHPRIPDRQEEGFSFSLKFERVIRQGKMPKGTDEIEVPFSLSGYATNWEFGAKPENGNKVMTCFTLRPDGSANFFPFSDGIRLLQSFDDPIVEHTKRVVGLWEIESPEELLKVVIAGRYDDDALFQAYCINALRNGSRSYNDLDLSDVLTHEMALSHIWDRYTAKAPMPLETLGSCENALSNDLRALEWRSHPARHDALRRTFQYLMDRPNSPTVWGRGYWSDMIFFREHARENYRLLLELVEGPDSNKWALGRMKHIYQPDSNDAEAARVNREIVSKLVELIASDDEAIARAAADAIESIAFVQAQRGKLDERFALILRGKSKAKLPDHVLRDFQYMWRRIQAIEPTDQNNQVAPLCYPWSKLVSKRVSATAYFPKNDKWYGPSVTIGNRILWIEGMDEFPDSIRGRRVRVTGELTTAHDLPVFRYEPGKPFQEGLPVPEGYELKDLSRRYLLKNATFEVLP